VGRGLFECLQQTVGGFLLPGAEKVGVINDRDPAAAADRFQRQIVAQALAHPMIVLADQQFERNVAPVARLAD
jgi:Flp pilus assembly protein CpaB